MLKWPQPVAGETPRDAIERVFEWAAELFVWTGDPEAWQRPEHWPLESELEEHAELNDGMVEGDCDDHASLCRYALWKLDVPNRLLICDVEPAAAPRTGGNHCVLTPEGTGLVLDCRQPCVMSRQALDDIGYLFFYASGLAPGDPWGLVKL